MNNNVKKAAVIGWPVKQSLSPVLHGFWLKHYGINGAYEACAVVPENLEVFMESLRGGDYVGINVTLPHKEKVIQYLDEWDESAKATGAVNAITIKNGRLLGTNTDVYGFMEHLQQAAPYARRNAVILGAGGAARAVCKALAMDNFEHITICSRSDTKAQAVAALAGGKARIMPWDMRNNLLKSCDLLVNTTPLGMSGKEKLELDVMHLPPHAIVYDIVYNPLMTDLLAHAQHRGNKIIDGLGMLMHQAVPCFEAWFGVRPEVTRELRQHLLGQIS